MAQGWRPRRVLLMITTFRERRGMRDVFPVKDPATIDNAKSLLTRLNFIREQILPQVQLDRPG